MSVSVPVRYLPGEALLALHRRRGPVINSGIGRHGYTDLPGGERIAANSPKALGNPQDSE